MRKLFIRKSIMHIALSLITVIGNTNTVYAEEKTSIIQDTDMIYTYPEMAQDIQELASRFPTIIQYDSLGETCDSRQIYHLTIGSKTANKHILIDAGIHAREWMNPYLVMQQVEEFVANLDSKEYKGQTYRSLLDDVCIHVIPMVNPDGITISQIGLDGLNKEETRTMVSDIFANNKAKAITSKSLNSYLREWKANAKGIDINRNFPCGFRQGSGTQYTEPADKMFSGSIPLSSQEARALANVVESYNPKIIINYHSQGEIIYATAEGQHQLEKNKRFAKQIASVTGYKVQPTTKASEFNGGFLEWSQSRNTPVLTVTIETGKVACPLPASAYKTIWKQNKNVLVECLTFMRTDVDF